MVNFGYPYNDLVICKFSTDYLLRTIMLYSLCMKFQDQLENRILCETFSSRQNSEVHPSVTTHEELKNVFE